MNQPDPLVEIGRWFVKGLKWLLIGIGVLLLVWVYGYFIGQTEDDACHDWRRHSKTYWFHCTFIYEQEEEPGES